jgi:hypothetical protein
VGKQCGTEDNVLDAVRGGEVRCRDDLVALVVDRRDHEIGETDPGRIDALAEGTDVAQHLGVVALRRTYAMECAIGRFIGSVKADADPLEMVRDGKYPRQPHAV